MKLFIFCLLAVAADAVIPLKSYNIDPNNISLSGLSAGAFMAVQMDVTYSNTFMGVGVVAGGPYWCAKDSVAVAVRDCMTTPFLINVGFLQQITCNTAATGFAAPVVNLQDHRVYLYSGTKDTVVVPGVVEAAEEYYRGFVDSANIMTEYSIPSEHGFPTMNHGGPCDEKNPDFINKCGYDAAFQMIKHIYRGAQKPDYTAALEGTLLTFDQTEFFNGGIFNYNGFDDEGFIFVPDRCSDGSTMCRLHVSLHGCLQGKEFIGNTFATQTGYNEVAVANDLIVLYPQIKRDPLLNPNGCFDWWGYTDASYASNAGVQTTTIYKMVERILMKAKK